MAKLPNGIFGPVIGKVGPVVGAKWKDVAYLRSLPAKSNQPASPAQINNQEKFKFMNQFLMPFQPYLTIGLANKAKKMTTLNAAYSLNHKQAVLGSFPDFSLDYTKLIWSYGSLPNLMGLRLEISEANVLKFYWEQDRRQSARFNDQVMLLIYCPALKITDGIMSGVNRADQYCSFTCNPKLTGHDVEVYSSIYSFDRKKVADSQYLGKYYIPQT